MKFIVGKNTAYFTWPQCCFTMSSPTYIYMYYTNDTITAKCGETHFSILSAGKGNTIKKHFFIYQQHIFCIRNHIYSASFKKERSLFLPEKR